MSKIITNNITPRSGSSVGLTGDLTASGNITGVGGTFSGPVSGTTGTFSGNVSVGGTLTYEDVTNIDSVGVVTARTGIKVLAGDIVVGTALTINQTGIDAVGVVTASSVSASSFTGSGSQLTGLEQRSWLFG